MVLKTYFKVRVRLVVLNGAASDVVGIICATPQRSVLRILLFLVYGKNFTNETKFKVT